MRALIEVLLIGLDLFTFILIVHAILSWLLAFGVINRHNQFVMTVYSFTQQLIEPLLRPIRRFVPTFNGLDLSFIVLWLLLALTKRVIIYYVLSPIIQAGL